MRKIFKAVLILSVMSAAFSCTMDLRQPGAIDADNAMTSIQDAQNLRRGLYVNFRGIAAGGFVTNAEIQSDYFQPTSGYGNNYGPIFRWEFNSTEAACESVWASCYTVISNCNFFIEQIEKVLSNPTEAFTDDDIDLLNLYLGEAYFFRAYCHYELAYRYCQVYDENTAANTFGVPYIEVYNPTPDKDTYPARGYLADTYSKINDDLDLAEELITVSGSRASMWLTSDVVSAFRARVYLAMKDYDNVITYSEPLISKYPLVTSAADFQSMWVNDSGSECIMQLDASSDSNNQPTSYDAGYIGYQVSYNDYQPMYVPSLSVVQLYQEYPADLRYAQFFTRREAVTPAGSDTIYLFTKFPGNPDLNPQGMTGSQSAYLHKNKPFRIAEVYLNLAEAYLESGNTTGASSMLQSLREARIPGYTQGSYSSQELRQQIKNERQRELIGEGFRLWDLKRWGDPVVRGAAQSSDIMYNHSSVTGQIAPANDPRFVWPIPQTELDSNPNMAPQQNPGY